MANAIQLRRGTTAEHSTFTGLVGEVTVDTTKDTIVVHDGTTAGGVPLAKESALSTYATTASLATVATSGDYTDLTNTPTIPVAGTDFVAVTGGAFTGDVSFGDTNKAIFGAGSNLSIYTDGNTSFIQETGAGNFAIDGTNIFVRNGAGTANMASFIDGGAVSLYHNSTARLATTSTGIDVTGTVTADGLTVDTNTLHVDAVNNRVGIGTSLPDALLHVSSAGSAKLRLGITESDGHLDITRNSSTGDIEYNAAQPTFGAHVWQTAGAERMRIAAGSGNVGIGTNSPAYKLDVSGELKASSYNETFTTLSGTTPTVDCEAGNVFALSTSGNTTFTFSNPPASGTAYGFTLKVTAGGTHTLTWPASVDWAGGTAPDAPASGETDVFVFFTHDGGTTWYGFQAGDAMA